MTKDELKKNNRINKLIDEIKDELERDLRHLQRRNYGYAEDSLRATINVLNQYKLPTK